MFKGDVLVLNRALVPIYLVTMEEAIRLLFRGGKILLPDGGTLDLYDWLELSPYILEEHDYEVIKTSKTTLIRPRVVISPCNNNLRYAVRISRKLLYIRDNFTCQYCGKKLNKHNASIDHVLPKSRGGKTIWTNVVLACRTCNHKKNNRTPEEAGMKLLKKPKTPTLIHLIQTYFKNEPFFAHWEKFLFKL